MLTAKEFENIIDSPESSILDFKAKNYDFFDDKELKNTSKFVKDVISFSNTIRNEVAYIILGIGENADGSKILHGLSENINDAIFQDKIKDKVFPRPKFAYYTFPFQEKKFGVLEFPITKYPMPICPVIKMKGLEVGTVYYRQGTANTKANSHEVIRINDWLRSLPETIEARTLYEEVTELIQRITQGQEKLSSILTDTLQVARKYRLNELVKFCLSELLGMERAEIDINPEDYKHRIQKVLISPQPVEISPFYNVTASSLKNELEKRDDFFPYQLLFSKPIVEIEEYIERMGDNSTTICATLKMSWNRIFPDDKKRKDDTVYVYIFKDSFISLYAGIKQKTIDKLVRL